MGHTMVDYSEWISIASATAESVYGSPTFEEASGNVEVFAEIWNRRKQEIKQASEVEAAEIAQVEL